MEFTLDCRGLACPQPVLRCKACLESDHPARLTVTVDNEAARENVGRYLGREGYAVTVSEEENGLFVLAATSGSDAPAVTPSPAPTSGPAPAAEATQKTVVFITADAIGQGDPTLGAKLMINFCATLLEMEYLWRIILLNGGVKLAIAGSPVLDSLKALQQAGVSILVCGTCLDFFGILQQKMVGETTNMLDVVTSLSLADKVIQI